MAWTIEIEHDSKNYKRIDFDRSLSPEPTEFTATVEYDASIAYFDRVEILNGGILEWYGYVEKIKPFWTKTGRYMKLWGRDRTVILWKKFTERFSDSRLEGFFGSVDPALLLHFLLRCPISDAPTTSSFHKIGWGLDSTNWVCTAIRTANGREEDWVGRRITGLAWALGPIYDNDCEVVDAFTAASDMWVKAAGGNLGDEDFIITYIEADPNGRVNVTYSLLTGDANIGDWDIDVVQANIFEVGQMVRLSQNVVGGVHGGTHELLTIAAGGIVGNNITFTSQLTKNYTVAGGGGALMVDGIIDDGYTFGNLDHTNGKITSAYIDFYGCHEKNSWGPPWSDVDVRVYIDVGAGYQYMGIVKWVDGENPVGLSYGLVKKSIDISSVVTTYAEANACKLKIDCTGGDATRTFARISEVRLRVTGYSYQTNGDWFEVDLGASKDRVTGIYIESRKSANAYPRKYKIQAYYAAAWHDVIADKTNPSRDVIESWVPVDGVTKMRIWLTANANFPWEISQIYIYLGDTKKYCILNEGTGISPPQYLGTVTLGDYVTPEDEIKPLNLPFDRANANVERVVKQCHDTNYDTWLWWVDHADGEFHFAARKGSDKTGTISFLKGTHIEDAAKEGDVRSCVSRARVVGKSESKKQDEVTSDWKMNAAAEANINTFFEKVLSLGKPSDKDTADVMAEVEVRAMGEAEETFEVHVSNDTHAAMAYDVGDDVTVTDSLSGMSGAHRIFHIHKTITKKGPEVTLTVKSLVRGRWLEFGDEWAEVKRQLREITGAGTTIEDWLAEGANQDKLDAEKITGEWEKSAKNDEEEPPDKTDDAWELTGDGSWSQAIETEDDWFLLKGSKDAGAGHNLEAYVKNTESTTENIRFDKDPKFVCVFKIPRDLDMANLILNPTVPTEWRDTDEIFLLMSNAAGSIRFGFKITKQHGQYNLHMVLVDAGAGQTVRAIETAEGTSANPVPNVKYRLEAVVDWDAGMVRYYFNNELLGILLFDSGEDGTSTMFPIYASFDTSQPAAVIYWSQIYIYRWRSHWEWVA